MKKKLVMKSNFFFLKLSRFDRPIQINVTCYIEFYEKIVILVSVSKSDRTKVVCFNNSYALFRGAGYLKMTLDLVPI